VPTTQPEAIEQYSIRVAEQWKLGRKKVDDGAILLVAKNDRALRIEVGYGLEGALTDLLSRRIIDDIITPHFRAGDFDGGITAGVDAILKVIDGEPLPAPAVRSTRPHVGLSPGLLFAALFVAWSFARGLASMFGPMRAGLVSGGIVGALGFFILKSIAFASGLGFLAFILTAIFGSGGGLGGAAGRRRGPWDGFGGFGGGGWGGGSGGGWGSGGGGFSGGGGGFGGGGASGRW
jgi:uncharacterized protein